MYTTPYYIHNLLLKQQLPVTAFLPTFPTKKKQREKRMAIFLLSFKHSLPQKTHTLVSYHRTQWRNFTLAAVKLRKACQRIASKNSEGSPQKVRINFITAWQGQQLRKARLKYIQRSKFKITTSKLFRKNRARDKLAYQRGQPTQ